MPSKGSALPPNQRWAFHNHFFLSSYRRTRFTHAELRVSAPTGTGDFERGRAVAKSALHGH